MGCDIHVHTEIKVNGKWEHYSHRSVLRNYDLFSLMAGARESPDFPCIVEPKGLPDDLTIPTAINWESWDLDAHHVSWMNPTEVAELYAKCRELDVFTGRMKDWGFSDSFGWLFGNGYNSFLKYPEDYPKQIEDFRWVFWFDN
jgi:hypothetical protein